jgi:hypothetical protein
MRKIQGVIALEETGMKSNVECHTLKSLTTILTAPQIEKEGDCVTPKDLMTELLIAGQDPERIQVATQSTQATE